MNYVGIDHHRQYSHLTVMDRHGQVLRSGRRQGDLAKNMIRRRLLRDKRQLQVSDERGRRELGQD